MAKINILSTLENKTENKIFNTETKGIYNNNRIIYKDNDVKVLIEIISDEEIRITREHEDYKVIIPLKINEEIQGYYYLKKLGNLNLNTNCKKIKIDQNNIELNYELNIEHCEKTIFEFNINLTREEK